VRRRPADEWIADEPRFGDVLRRVARRAWGRSLLLIGLTAVATLFFVARRLGKDPMYEANARFVLSESDVEEAPGGPRPPTDIRGYVEAVALNRTNLLRIMEERGISRRLRQTDPVAAEDDFRDEIGVSVERNYFLFEREPGEPRTASLSVSYASADENKARAVVHDVGRLIVDAQTAERRAHVDGARALAELELEGQHVRLRDLEKQVEELGDKASTGRSLVAAEAEAELVSAGENLKLVRERVSLLEKRVAELSFASAAEGERLGVDLKLVDENVAVFAPPLGLRQIIELAVTIFCGLGLLFLVALGGWNQVIEGPGDVAAAGLPLLGVLGRFAGDEVGSYRQRTRKAQEKRGILRRWGA
jgi:hypothetical protein